MSNSSNPAIDPDGFASLEEMIGPDMPELVAEILDTYIVEATGLLEAITASLAEQNWEEMLRPVHSLKSSSASVGALRLAQICAELEQFLRGHGPELDVDVYVQNITVEFGLVEAELENLRDEYASR